MSAYRVHCLTLHELARGGASMEVIEPRAELQQGEIHIWQLDLDRPPEPIEKLASLLCDSERQRAQRFHFEVHRRRYIVRRAVLRRVLAGYLDIDAAEVPFAENSYGKPRLADADFGQGICFNTSHCENRSLCVLTRDRCIGVDLETCSRSRHFDWPQLGKQFVHVRELVHLSKTDAMHRDGEYLRLWTLKEAFVKALGSGLSSKLTELDTSDVLAGDCVAWVDPHGRRWLFHNIELDDDDAIASIVVAD